MPTTYFFRPLLALLVLGSYMTAESVRGASDRPNVVFILADDLGWAELGCYGNKFNETPHLDRLASRSMRFSDAYAAAPVCSPYRAALMSGQWPARVGITDYLRPSDPKHLTTGHVTIAEMFKAANYDTAMLGKWHLTGYRNHGAEEVPPTEHGFDEAIVTENRGIGGGSYFHPYHFNREIKQRLESRGSDGREYLTDRLNREAVDFIDRQRKAHKNRPFFLFKSHYAVHTRLVGRPDLIEKYAKKPGAGLDHRSRRNNVHLAAQLEVIDEGVGMIMAKLDELGIADRTIIVFTSDNGGEDRVTSNAPLRAGKSTLYEGGIREPLIFHWPGVTKPGAVCDKPVVNIDFYPTFAAAIGTTSAAKQRLDGVSFVPLLKDADATLDRDALFWHYPLKKLHFLGGRSGGAIRAGDYKLIEDYTTGELELYNLAVDIGEQRDLESSLPQKTRELHAMLQAWRESLEVEPVKHGSQAKTAPRAGARLVPLAIMERRRDFMVRGANIEGDTMKFDGDDAVIDLPRDDAPAIARRAISVRAVIHSAERDGVVLAHGGDRSGYALYVKDGRAAFSVCVDWKRTTIMSAEPLPDGEQTLHARLDRDGTLQLTVDGKTTVEAMAKGPLESNPGDSMQIGADLIKPVGAYDVPNHFKGVIKNLRIQIGKPSEPRTHASDIRIKQD